MTVVVALLRSVDADAHLEDDRLAASLAMRGHGDRAGLGISQVAEVEDLAAGEAECLRVLARGELAGQYAHADQVGAVDALEALGDHGLHAEQHRAFGGPVARRPGAVLLAGQHDQRRPR